MSCVIKKSGSDTVGVYDVQHSVTLPCHVDFTTNCTIVTTLSKFIACCEICIVEMHLM